jgi:hypothetical protein
LAEGDIALADRDWKVVRQFVEGCCGIRPCCSACTRYQHRLGSVHKRLEKRLLKADEAHFRTCATSG